jgi:hypothetical protein
MTAEAHNKKRRVINIKAAVRKGQQTGAKAGNYLAKVGVEGSNPFARSNKTSQEPGLSARSDMPRRARLVIRVVWRTGAAAVPLDQ